MKQARALFLRASLSSQSFALVGIFALGSFWGSSIFADHALFEALKKTSSHEEAEYVLGRKLGNGESRTDRFIDSLSVGQINELNDSALLALLRRSSLGVSLRIAFLLPQDADGRRRSSPITAQAELYKVGRELRGSHYFENPGVIAGGLSLAAFAVWSHVVGMPNVDHMNPEQAQLVLRAMMGTAAAFPIAFFGAYRSSSKRKFKRHSTLLNVTALTMKELILSGAVIDAKTEQTISDTFEEIAMRCYPKRTLENNYSVRHGSGDYFYPLPLKDRIDQVFSVYAHYLKVARFENEKVERHARRSAERIVETLKLGLRLPELAYTKPERDIFSDAINAIDPPTSLAEVQRYIAANDTSGGTMYASENYDDSPYRESARDTEDERLPIVHLEPRDPKAGPLFEASFSRRTIWREENQMHFSLGAELYRELSNKTTQKEFLPAVEHQLPSTSGTWIRYTDLGKSDFTYVSEENFPKRVPFEFVGNVELWERPWSDKQPYVVFSGAAGTFLSGEKLRAAWEKNLTGRATVGASCAKAIRALAFRRLWGNADSEG